MRIAQVAPLIESVPPRLYGGTERVVSYLTEELVRLGHDVTLFASGDSMTRARLRACRPTAMRLDGGLGHWLPEHLLQLESVFQSAAEFDVVHFHTDYLHFPLSRRWGIRQLSTLHGRLDLPGLAPLYAEFQDMPVVSISDAQRKPLPRAGWLATVYHGLPRDLYAFQPRGQGYFAWVGRISPEKGFAQAVEIAERCGRQLRVAAKVDPVDVPYFKSEIEPLLGRPSVGFLGELGDAPKARLLGGADALLFPVDWPEPFGLVMIEALACGTPVIAARRGSVPELIEDGVTGFVVDGVDEAVAAAARLGELDRRRCRTVFDERFGVERMARDYLGLYADLAGGVSTDGQRALDGAR